MSGSRQFLHKLIELSLKKGECVQINNGTPVAVLGKDSHSRSSRNNYLIWHSNGKVYSLSENKILNISKIDQELRVVHSSEIGPSPAITSPTPRPAQVIKSISVSGEQAPHSVGERPAILDDWWLALNVCLPIGPLPFISVLVILVAHTLSHGFHSLLYSFAAMAIGIAGGLVGFAIRKLGKRSVVAVLTAYGQAIYLNLVERAVALCSKQGREGPAEAR